MDAKRAADAVVLAALLLSVGYVLSGSPPPPVEVDHPALLIVRESGELHELTDGQRIAIESAQSLARELGYECWVIDPDQDIAAAPPWVSAGRAMADNLPFFLAVNGRRWKLGPVPDSPAALKAALESLR